MHWPGNGMRRFAVHDIQIYSLGCETFPAPLLSDVSGTSYLVSQKHYWASDCLGFSLLVKTS